MVLKLIYRLIREVDPRLLWKLAFNLCLRNAWAMFLFNRRLRRGVHFPPVLFLSITNRCNLRCQGCWVTVGGRDAPSLDVTAIDRIITQAKRRGNALFGLLGGEPLLHDGLWDVIRRHSDCYFQILTNGTLLTDSVARRMRQAGNVTPLISIEGAELVSDERRGGRDVFRRTLDGLDACRRNRLLTGVATSVCKSNIDDLVSEEFVRELIRRGAHYLWYYIYRPVGPAPNPQLALDEEQVVRLRRFMVETRMQAPLILVDAYWDHLGRALCPAVTGISHHINAFGQIEPCPPIQIARDRIDDGDIFDVVSGSEFLRDFRRVAGDVGRGCILMERPDVLREFMVKQGALDSSGRDSVAAELAAMQPRCGHDMSGREIPEKHWAYRFAKKHWFFGFGAYG